MAAVDVLAVLAVLMAVALQAPAPPAPIVAHPGPPVLIEEGGAATWFLMTEAAYRTFVDQHAKESAAFVPIARKPDGLSPRAQYGLNLIVGGKNLSWIVDGSQDEGYTLYADWNANGDLTDDPPLRFAKKNGKDTLHVEREMRDAAGAYPFAVTLVLDFVAPPGSTEPKLAMKQYNRTTRSGDVALPDGHRIPFRLTGAAGSYAESYDSVAFDVNGDGRFDPQTEVFRVSEKRVNLGDVSYEFAVDPHGATLTLTPLAGHLASRVPLTPGSPAPDFTFVDLAGAPHKLSDYRGKVVLLDFWGVWCAPCVAEAPKLAALYAKFHDRGLEILGLDTLDAPETVRAFIAAHGHTWTQTLEPEKGPLQTLYRVNGWPTYFLVNRDGTIVRAPSGSDTDLDALVSTVIK